MMLPPASLADHLPRRRLAEMEHAGQVDRDDAVPGLGIEVEEIRAVADPGAFEQHVEPAELAHRRRDRVIDRRAVAHVERLRRRRDRRRRGCAPAVASAAAASISVHRRRRALARQALGAGAADAAARPRHQRHLALDPAHRPPPLVLRRVL